MNILQIVSSSRTSGAERHIVILSEELQRLGHNVLAICPPGGWLPEQLQLANVPMVELPMHGPKALGSLLAIRHLARRHHADVIHTHLTRATYMGYLSTLFTSIPIISTVHILTRDRAYRMLPGGRHCLIAVSNHVRNSLLARGAPADRVVTIYNGTDFIGYPAGQSLLSVRAEFGLPADAELTGAFGRIDDFKGQELLVRAAGKIVAKRPRAYFIFVGKAEPDRQQRLWELAQADGVADRLRFTGIRNDVPRLMAEIDVLALPSRTEACSMVTIEAMALGRAVIATNAGGNPELILDNETGMLIERSPDAIADAVIKILSNPELRHRMEIAGKQRANELFSAGVMARHVERLYRRCAGLPAAGG